MRVGSFCLSVFIVTSILRPRFGLKISWTFGPAAPACQIARACPLRRPRRQSERNGQGKAMRHGWAGLAEILLCYTPRRGQALSDWTRVRRARYGCRSARCKNRRRGIVIAFLSLMGSLIGNPEG